MFIFKKKFKIILDWEWRFPQVILAIEKLRQMIISKTLSQRNKKNSKEIMWTTYLSLNFKCIFKVIC